ncbi:unnamed protein product [Ectocarpus sp. 13 AM-2016]
MVASIRQLFVVGTSSTSHFPPPTGISEYTYSTASLSGRQRSGGYGRFSKSRFAQTKLSGTRLDVGVSRGTFAWMRSRRSWHPNASGGYFAPAVTQHRPFLSTVMQYVQFAPYALRTSTATQSFSTDTSWCTYESSTTNSQKKQWV